MNEFLYYLLVPLAVGAVAVVLVLGLVNMARGGSPMRSQKLMRLRVLLQFVAIVIIMLTIWALQGLSMVVLNRIYTRTGDEGTTALGSGERRKKYDLRIEAYGTLDEVNAVIGLVRLHAAGDAPLDAMLARIQNDLFDVEADLCLSAKGPGAARLTVTAAQVTWLEQQIDALNEHLAPLKSFVLPGGTPAAAYLHLARTVCRRAERMMVALKDRPGETVTAESLQYVNRLSDFLFVASRHANDSGARDVLWAPGANR